MPLIIEVTTSACAEGECFQYVLPSGSSMAAAAEAAEVLYPDITGLWMSVEEDVEE